MKNNSFRKINFSCLLSSFNSCNQGGTGITDPISGDVFTIQYKNVNAMQVDTIQLPQYTTLSIKMAKILDLRLTTNITNCELLKLNSDLKGNFERTLYKFDKKRTHWANLLGYNGRIDENQVLYMLDFTKFAMINCNGRKKYCIGLR